MALLRTRGANRSASKQLTMMTIAAVAITALGLASRSANATEPQSTAVTTESGAVQGVHLSGNISAFRGRYVGSRQVPPLTGKEFARLRSSERRACNCRADSTISTPTILSA
jgi:hypothetical protein